MISILNLPSVLRYIDDLCVYQPNPYHINKEWGYVKKPTGWATGCPEIGKRLSKRCPGGRRHVSLGGATKKAEIYGTF